MFVVIFISLVAFVIASRMSDTRNSTLELISLGVLSVFYIWLLALIYFGVIYCYFVVNIGSVITAPAPTPFSWNLTVWVADGGDKGKCKISVQNLARETRLADFATLRPFGGFNYRT